MNNELNRAFGLVSQPDNRLIREGEALIGQLKKQSAYPLALIDYMNNTNNFEQQLRAAIELRLWCESYKGLEQYERNYYSDILEQIKNGILRGYLNFPIKISKTLRPGIVNLADIEFPDRWPSLLPTLLQCANENSNSTAGVLKLIQSISEKYSYLTRSDPLYHEIIIMCDGIHDFMLTMTVNLIQGLHSDSGNASIEVLTLLIKVFYNLNYQDLHPKFEDNLSNWMQILKKVMAFKNTNQSIFKCKGAALESILLYACKYREEVQELIKQFCSEIWQLCSNATDDPEYDKIVFNCLKFFKSLIMWTDMKGFFSQNMDNLIVNLILPHLAINNRNTLSLFNDELSVYIDYYFRNTELQTRRAAALELMRVICRHYDSFQPFLTAQISNYRADSPPDLQCTLMNLIIDGGCKGFRDVDGCTSLYIDEKIVQATYQGIVKITLADFYGWIIANPKACIESAYNVLHLSTILRFLFYFRIYLPVDELSNVIKFICTIKTQNNSLKMVLYTTLNGFLSLRHGDYSMYRNFVNYFNAQTLTPIAPEILQFLHNAAQYHPQLEESVAKTLFTLVRQLGEANGLFADTLIKIVRCLLKKTTQYDFNSVFLLFEAIGMLAYELIRSNSQSNTTLEADILTFFKMKLNTHSDLVNFCFQIFCVYVACCKSSPANYLSIYESLLQQSNWIDDNTSVMSAYVQYLSTFLLTLPVRIAEDKPKIQIILSKLISLNNYQLFYRFLETILKGIGIENFYNSGYMALAVQGSEVIMNNSIQSKKSAFIFVCKTMSIFDTKTVFSYFSQISSQFVEALLSQSKDIIQSMQMRRDRRYMFSALCHSIANSNFANAEFTGTLLNLLIDNTVNRFNFSQLAAQNQQNEQSQKKEATFKKLTVFREKGLQVIEQELAIDEEILLVQTYIYCDQVAKSFISEKNVERVKRLSEKHAK